MSLQAYQQAQKAIENPREAEYRIFGQVTAGLLDAAKPEAELKQRIHALGENRKLWSTLAMDCASEGNQLTEALRAQIISLSLWVSRYSSDVMRENAPIDPLIEVNRTIMEGLKASA